MAEPESDFLGFIRKRRSELQRQLEELAVAERIWRESGVQLATSQGRLVFPADAQRQPRTIKEMVVQILGEVEPHGLTALEILSRIKGRWYPDLERTSLSPQLSRLRAEQEIVSERGVWKLLKPDAPLAAAGEA